MSKPPGGALKQPRGNTVLHGLPPVLRACAILAVIVAPLAALRWSWPILSWLSQGNYAAGLAEFLIGAMGGLLAAYLLLGVLLPPMGRVRVARNELRSLKDMQRDLFTKREQYVRDKSVPPHLDLGAAHTLGDDLENTIGRLEQSLRDEQWRFYRVAIPLYAILGGLVSATLTPAPKEGLSPDQVWQALMIGIASCGIAIAVLLIKEWLEQSGDQSQK